MKRQTHVLANGQLMRQEVPQVRPEVCGDRATTRGSLATEEIVLNTAPTTFNQRVTPSCSGRGHGDGHLTVGPRTQTMHGNRTPVHKVAEREFVGEGTEEREHHSSARVQERQRCEAQVKGAPQRVDVGWRARSTPTPPGRDVFRSRVRGQGSLRGRRSLRAQMIAQPAIRNGGGRKRSRQLLRGAQHAPQPGMVRRHSSTGGSTEVKGSLGAQLPRRGPQAFTVAEMSARFQGSN
jgi:hypothetical protein